MHIPVPIQRSIIPATVAMLLLPVDCHAAIFLDAAIQLRAEIISFLNLALFITALISIKQFFWPGDNNTLPFQIFNIIFVVLFYAISLPFLVTHRQYYEEYQHLVPLSVLVKFFLSINISSFAQWVIIASVFVNILYIGRYRKDYFQAGIATTKDTPQEILQESIAELQEEIREEILEEEEDGHVEEELPYKSSESEETVEEQLHHAEEEKEAKEEEKKS